MVEMELMSDRDRKGGSIEYDSDKEVIGESIVVLSWKGHFTGRKHDSPDFSLSCYCTDLEIITLTEEGGNAAAVEASVPN